MSYTPATQSVIDRIKAGLLADGTTGITLYDIQVTDTHIYQGVAAPGASKSTGNAWDVIRFKFVLGKPAGRGHALGINWADISTATYLEETA